MDALSNGRVDTVVVADATSLLEREVVTVLGPPHDAAQWVVEIHDVGEFDRVVELAVVEAFVEVVDFVG